MTDKRDTKAETLIKRAELLAPAGDMDCFLSALRAGADAVYLGGKAFGARAYARNFTTGELITAIEKAHLFGRKVYLTLNTLFKDEELSEVYDTIAPLYEAGLDGVIIQDLGIVRLLGESFPGLPLHASTQMSVTDIEGVRLLQDLGIKRVVPARELSLKELTRIYDETGMELECFIHGALCYSYSGRCLMSSFIGGRSGNRGRCAGPCRLPYNGQYLLSAKDICTIEILDKLLAAGIYSFKIEGRMKSPEYVAGVTGLYRRRLDRILSGDTESKEAVLELKRDRERLINLYTRSGNSQGYYFQKNGPEMISVLSPSYESADDEEKKQLVSEVAGKDPAIFFDAAAYFSEGESCKLTLSCSSDTGFVSVSVQGAVCETAKTQALTEEEAKKQIGRTNDTEFVLKEFTCEIKGNVFLTKKALNELRREGIKELRNRLLLPGRREAADRRRQTAPLDQKPLSGSHKTEKVWKEDKGNRTGTEKALKSRLHISLGSRRGLSEALSFSETDIISIPYLSFQEKNRRKEIQDTCREIREAGRQFFLSLPKIVRNGSLREDPELGELLLHYTDGVLIDNPEELYYIRDICYDKLIVADLHLYAMNQKAAEVISESPRKSSGNGEGNRIITTVPCELNRRELYRRGLKGEELIVYGYLPMMLSSQCVKKTLGRCDHKEESLKLTDRYRNDFSCINLCGECTNVIYNSVPLFLEKKDLLGEDEKRGLLKELGPSLLRLEFTIENEKEISDIIEYYVNYKETPACIGKYTKGHLNRGVE